MGNRSNVDEVTERAPTLTPTDQAEAKPLTHSASDPEAKRLIESAFASQTEGLSDTKKELGANLGDIHAEIDDAENRAMKLKRKHAQKQQKLQIEENKNRAKADRAESVQRLKWSMLELSERIDRSANRLSTANHSSDPKHTEAELASFLALVQKANNLDDLVAKIRHQGGNVPFVNLSTSANRAHQKVNIHRERVQERAKKQKTERVTLRDRFKNVKLRMKKMKDNLKARLKLGNDEQEKTERVR